MSPSPVNVATPVAINPTPAGPATPSGSKAANDDPGAFGRELQRASERPAARSGSAEGTDGADAARPTAGKVGKTDSKARTGVERPSRREPADAGRATTPSALDPLHASADMLAETCTDAEAATADGELADAEAGIPDLASWMAHLLGVPVAQPPATGHPTGPAVGPARPAAAPLDSAAALPPDAAADTAAAAARPGIDSLRAAAPGHGTPGRGKGDDAATPGGPAASTAAAARDMPDASGRGHTHAVAAVSAEAATNNNAAPASAASPLPGAAPAVTATSPALAPAIAETTLAVALHGPGFAPALGTQIAHFARDGIEHARLQLNPAEMGPIAVQLALEGQQVRVDLVAELAATRQTLEQSLPALAGALRDAGFTLTGGGVFQQARDGSGSGDGRNAPATPTRDATAPDTHAAGRGPARTPRTQGLVDLFA